MKNAKWMLAYVSMLAVAVVGLAAQQPARGTPPPPPAPLLVAKYIGHDTIAGCSKAGNFASTPEYNVTCSNRTGPGMVEIHTKETDIIYVVDGAATFVTGGTAQNLKSDNPLQPRGTAITGGETHSLTKGDVVVVPAGQPHWFKEVSPSVSYYVVKVLKP